MKIYHKKAFALLAMLAFVGPSVCLRAQNVSVQSGNKTTSIKTDGNNVSISTNEQSGNSRRVRLTTRPTSAGGGKTITVVQNRQQLRYSLSGEMLVISGNNNDITVQGSCRQLSVTGNGNVIHLESVTSISAQGNKNQILWQAGNPQVSNLGSNNVVSRQ